MTPALIRIVIRTCVGVSGKIGVMTRMESADFPPAAYEVDNLIAVAGNKPRVSPPGARKDFEVSLDGHPVVGEFHLLKQVGNRQTLGNLPTLPVDLNGHHERVSWSGSGGGRGRDFTGSDLANDQAVLVLQEALEFLVAILAGKKKFPL